MLSASIPLDENKFLSNIPVFLLFYPAIHGKTIPDELTYSLLLGTKPTLLDNFQEPLCTRVVFLCLTVVLTIGVSTAGVTLYNYAILLERHRQEVEKELLSALNKDALVSEVHTGLSKKEEFVEWLALFALLSTPFLLLAYTILKMCVI